MEHADCPLLVGPQLSGELRNGRDITTRTTAIAVAATTSGHVRAIAAPMPIGTDKARTYGVAACRVTITDVPDQPASRVATITAITAITAHATIPKITAGVCHVALQPVLISSGSTMPLLSVSVPGA